jgi:hypothetical protein
MQTIDGQIVINLRATKPEALNAALDAVASALKTVLKPIDGLEFQSPILQDSCHPAEAPDCPRKSVEVRTMEPMANNRVVLEPLDW